MSKAIEKKYLFILAAIAVIFLILRLPGFTMPYHQDEYKWPLYAEEKIFAPGTIPHPPLTEFLYRVVGQKIGLENFRLIPLTFGFANIFLLFYLVKTISDKRTALWSAILFVGSFYSMLANIMVDVDGSVMPFFFLLVSIGYFKLREYNFVLRKDQIKWIALLAVGLVGGFLIKVSFLLSVAAILLDFVIEKNVFSDKKKMLRYFVYLVLFLASLSMLLVIIKFIFPFFNLSKALKYWEHFAVFSGRGWVQTFIQFVKSLLYISPLLLVPLLFIDREIWQKIRPMVFFLIIGTIFYLFVFDFSLGAMDRYFQFTIVPLVVIAGLIFAKYFEIKETIKKYDYIVITLFGIIITLTQFFNHFVPPLYPKTEWLGRLISLKWNFLLPFMGGSGPMPFYISFLFIGLLWLSAMIFAIFGLLNKYLRKRTFLAILILGLFYNGVFIQEYLFGKINGSSKKLVSGAVSYIEARKDIKNIVVYNDNGGWEVRKTGKYARRMYATPQFEAEYRKYLSEFTGYIMFVGIPKIDENSFYQKYFDSCDIIYERVDKKIPSMIYECNQ